MTNQETLKKAIEKAIKGGYKIEWDGNNEVWYDSDKHTPWESYSVYDIIFSHSFAKAFWGEEKRLTDKIADLYEYWWQFHLQQMVLEEQPLKYLEKFIE